jgi:hypothetical protein
MDRNPFTGTGVDVNMYLIVEYGSLDFRQGAIGVDDADPFGGIFLSDYS